ncbi:UDP-bacillosamine synthetase [Fusarium austroafricanum]|uniref:UDP-bacillosamine synthetase n=1 Tax=Fusarium austroafricanum TaxID=2364996 RepID=A0A8H4NWD9_9HYPO|nr:UDP-bacillosamine synthetase [Fusarium austroafricanum]
MLLIRHTNQERISTFFSRYCSLSQDECNTFAQSYLGCDNRQASPQGAFGYTVRGGGFVIQFRAERSSLDLNIIKQAPSSHSLQRVIEWSATESPRVDCAFVAVPHNKHFETVGPLLAASIHVLKEKPVSLPVAELRQLQEIAASCNQEWRSRGILADGVHVDLGWHLLDLVLDLLPDPQTPVVRFSEYLLTRPHQEYDAEDTYFASLLLASSTSATPDVPCYLKASRMSHHKADKICIIGSDGTLGQKIIISGGECGIMVTKHQEFHFRALIWGHYNKRFRPEIPDNHPLAPFALTGAGLKHRAHPIAVRIALNQLRQLPSFQQTKAFNSRRLQNVLKAIPFLTVPDLDPGQRISPA